MAGILDYAIGILGRVERHPRIGRAQSAALAAEVPEPPARSLVGSHRCW
jgi:hypothetical protein